MWYLKEFRCWGQINLALNRLEYLQGQLSMCCLSVLYPPSLPAFVLLKLNPVNISSFVRWQMRSFVSRGCYRRKGLSFLVPCACLLPAPMVNSSQHVKDTQAQGCLHLSKFHQHPRRQICSKCQQHSPRQPLRLATPQVPREFCGYPRATFHFVALLQTSPPYSRLRHTLSTEVWISA